MLISTAILVMLLFWFIDTKYDRGRREVQVTRTKEQITVSFIRGHTGTALLDLCDIVPCTTKDRREEVIYICVTTNSDKWCGSWKCAIANTGSDWGNVGCEPYDTMHLTITRRDLKSSVLVESRKDDARNGNVILYM